MSLKYPTFIFQFDPTRINQVLTTRHILDLDYFPAFPIITNFVSLSQRDEVYQGKASTSDDVAFLFSFTLAGHGCLPLTLSGLEVALRVERLG